MTAQQLSQLLGLALLACGARSELEVRRVPDASAGTATGGSSVGGSAHSAGNEPVGGSAAGTPGVAGTFGLAGTFGEGAATGSGGTQPDGPIDVMALCSDYCTIAIAPMCVAYEFTYCFSKCTEDLHEVSEACIVAKRDVMDCALRVMQTTPCDSVSARVRELCGDLATPPTACGGCDTTVSDEGVGSFSTMTCDVHGQAELTCTDTLDADGRPLVGCQCWENGFFRPTGNSLAIPTVEQAARDPQLQQLCFSSLKPDYLP